MIKFALRKWNENKDALEQHIRKDKNLNNCDYTTVDNGDYQGTKLFIIPEDRYQPSAMRKRLSYDIRRLRLLFRVRYHYGNPRLGRERTDGGTSR